MRGSKARMRHHRSMRRGRTWMVAPVLALAVLAGCSNNAALPSVTVVGDSVTSIEQPQLESALARDYATTYIVHTGGHIGEMSALLNSSINSNGTPKVVITNLGTTDALQTDGATTTGFLLAPLVSATSGVSCVVLTTVNVRTDFRPDQVPDGTVATRINHQIKLLEQSDPTKYKVVDWNEFLVTLPAASIPTYLQANRLMETAAGATWLDRSDLAAVHSCGSTHQPTVIGPNNA